MTRGGFTVANSPTMKGNANANETVTFFGSVQESERLID